MTKLTKARLIATSTVVTFGGLILAMGAPLKW